MNMRNMMVVIATAALYLGSLPQVTRAGGELASIRVASGLNRPVEITAAPGDTDRLFIVEQRGIIKILDLNTLQVLPVPFLDIDGRVSNGFTGNGEQGLFSITFHPKYFVPGDPNEGNFFVHYSSNTGASTIDRYTVTSNPNVADPVSRLQIFSMSQPFANHNGGQMNFGPCDGYLYVAFGDGGAGNDPGNRSQNLDLFYGKMLRLDVNNSSLSVRYAIPPDNPFVGIDGRDEIWAYGLRNPWRHSFDRITGDIYIGDVGQNAREEIDFQPAASSGGENYGWRCMEGNRCTGLSGCTCFDDALTDPIHEFFLGVEGRSITGGYVYRGCAIPALQGRYIFGDFVSGRIWTFKEVNGVATEHTRRDLDINPPDVGGIVNQIAAFGQDARGEIYIVDRGGASTGQIFRIVPETALPPPAGDPPAFAHTGDNGALFSGYIDPRGESTNGVDLDGGLTQLSVEFSKPVVNTDCTLVDASAFSLATTAGATPQIDSIETCNNQQFTVILTEPIPLQEWTTVIAAGVQDLQGHGIQSSGDLGPGVNETDRVDIGFLPCDVDQNQTVQPFDLLRFRQIVNDVFAPPQGAEEFFVDIDRSGTTSPFDLLRFRQLINGVSPPATQSWNDASMNSVQP